MSLETLEKMAMELPEDQRAALAMHILHSLPALFSEPDEGIAEARVRDAELDQNPSLGLSLEDLDRKVSGRGSGVCQAGDGVGCC